MRARALSKKRLAAASGKDRRPAKRPAEGSRAAGAADPNLVSAFPVVGIGASAGGLEAFTQLLSCLPTDTGMAFVLIQHLDPQHDSLLTQALSRATTMAVVEISDGMRIERNHVYVIPSNADVAILHGALYAAAAQQRSASAAPARRLLLSRAGGRPRQPGDRRRPLGNRLRRHRRPSGDQGRGWDHARPGSGFGKVRGNAAERDRRRRGRRGAARRRIGRRAGAARSPSLRRPSIRRHVVAKKDDETLKKIFVLVRNAVGVDYSEYKPATLQRRLAPPHGGAQGRHLRGLSEAAPRRRPTRPSSCTRTCSST